MHFLATIKVRYVFINSASYVSNPITFSRLFSFSFNYFKKTKIKKLNMGSFQIIKGSPFSQNVKALK